METISTHQMMQTIRKGGTFTIDYVHTRKGVKCGAVITRKVVREFKKQAVFKPFKNNGNNPVKEKSFRLHTKTDQLVFLKDAKTNSNLNVKIYSIVIFEGKRVVDALYNRKEKSFGELPKEHAGNIVYN